MQVRFPPPVEALRDEVRAFLADAMAPEKVRGHADPLDLTGLDEEFEHALLREAGQRGYLALDYPTEYGGAGLTVAHRAMFGCEAAAFDAPLVDTAITLAGAPILAYGTDEQRAAMLPRMARGEITCCIAFTEPGAGSDLGAIATTARRDPAGGWVIEGRKVLVTGAHKADWCLLVARTDPDRPPREAMSMFLVDMRTPGITVRRWPTANQWTLDEIVFDQARVPADALLGEEGRGFAQMAGALADERSGFFWVGWAERRLTDLLGHVRARRDTGSDPLDAVWRDRLARLWIDVALARALAVRVVDARARGVDTTVLAAASKVFVTELLQRIAATGVALLGPAGLLTGTLFGPADPHAPFHGRFAYECVERLHPTISVGSNEIQRDVLAHRGLGLPQA